MSNNTREEGLTGKSCNGNSLASFLGEFTPVPPHNVQSLQLHTIHLVTCTQSQPHSHTHTPTHPHTHTLTHPHTHTLTHSHTHTHTLTHPHTHTPTHPHTHTLTHPHTTLTLTHPHTHTDTHTPTHSHIHTLTITYFHRLSCIPGITSAYIYTHTYIMLVYN